MTRFVGGPYDGCDFSVSVKRIQLPDPASEDGAFIDGILPDTISDDRAGWPHKYALDESGGEAVYRYLGASPELVLFVGGPYDGERLPADLKQQEIRLPPEDELDAYYVDPNQTASQTWPYVYWLDDDANPPVYRFVK